MSRHQQEQQLLSLMSALNDCVRSVQSEIRGTEQPLSDEGLAYARYLLRRIEELLLDLRHGPADEGEA